METMHKPTEFISSVDIWTNEITGNILRVNDAASKLEFELYKPTRLNNNMTVADRISIAGAFHTSLNILYKNAYQILSNETKKEVGEWLRNTLVDMSIKSNVDTGNMLRGIAMSQRLQDELYDRGLKEIGIDDPIEFPYEFYQELVT